MNRREALSVMGLTDPITEDSLKKQFKTLALQWHPDRNKTSGAAVKFNKIFKAYDYLKDHIKAPLGVQSFTRTVKSRTFHRPGIDFQSDWYKNKFKPIAEIVLGSGVVDQTEKQVQHTQDSIDRIFDLFGIDKE